MEVTGCAEYQESTFKDLVINNLPIVSLKKSKKKEVFVDARTFLSEPSLIVDMWETTKCTKEWW